MFERRRRSRKKAQLLIDVLDQDSGRRIGCVVNLSAEGMMLFSESEIPVAAIFQFRLVLEDPVDGREGVKCGAESLWSSPANSENSYWTGFQIIDISDEDSRFLNTLISDWVEEPY